MINEYLENLKEWHENFRLRPKHHFMTHFGDQMKNFGPLRHHHCFRFEQKNGQIKDAKCTNSINISYSLSMRQQYWLAGKQAVAKLRNSVAFLGNETVIDEEVSKESEAYRILRPRSHLSICKHVKMDGFSF